MKVIDLLNKIANGEEAPKKIKYDNDIYTITKDKNLGFREYKSESENGVIIIMDFDLESLNENIEIIEEEQDIEEIPYQYLDGDFDYFKGKINELIKEVNKLKNK